MARVVRKEVLRALEKTEARGEKRVRVVIGLRSAGSAKAVSGTLNRLGAQAPVREAERFLVARLTREEIDQVSQLAQHVKAVWLDQPVSATDG